MLTVERFTAEREVAGLQPAWQAFEREGKGGFGREEGAPQVLSHLKLPFPAFQTPATQATSAWKQWAKERTEGDTRGVLRAPVLSCAHYFQAPATQASGFDSRNRTNTQGLGSDWGQSNQASAPILLRINFVFGLDGKLSRAGTLELSNAPSSIQAFLMFIFLFQLTSAFVITLCCHCYYLVTNSSQAKNAIKLLSVIVCKAICSEQFNNTKGSSSYNRLIIHDHESI